MMHTSSFVPFIIIINLYIDIYHILSHTTCTVYWICNTKTSIQQQRTKIILKHHKIEIMLHFINL